MTFATGPTPTSVEIFKDSKLVISDGWFTLNKYEDIFTINEEISRHLQNLKAIKLQIGGRFHQGDFDCILVEHIMDVPVNEIERYEIREEKLYNVRKWADKKNLHNPKTQDGCPVLERVMDSQLRFNGYSIDNGIHRTQRARELGSPHIKAMVWDVIYINFSFREDIKL